MTSDPIPIPEWLAQFLSSLAHDGYFERDPDQVIVNEYEPGQGISPHVDTGTPLTAAQARD